MAASSFLGVRIQGGLLPTDLLSKAATGKGLDGMTSEAYHLAAGESIREAANRAWAYLTGVWAGYRTALDALPATDYATALTRERWLLILLNQLGYGRVPVNPADHLTVADKTFPISHHWEQIPIHLLGARVELDKRTAKVAGAATASPQSLVQEFLNRSEAHLWGILSNGRVLRLLRDSTVLAGSAYVEFDLEAIFDGELFADFLLLFALAHQSRLEVRDPEIGPASCWLETWRTTELDQGSRALNLLRDGVVTALTTLGTGFLAHPANAALRARVEQRDLSLDDLNHALLRVVYRMLFTFVAEDREVLLAADAPPQARQRYTDYFSTSRLRRIARRRRGGRHGDLWHALNLVWAGLGSIDGRPELGIVGIGGLFEPGDLDVLTDCDLSNERLLTAIRALSVVQEPKSGFKRVVDYRNLGAEELGSIYEALLEYVPNWDSAAKTFTLGTAAGNTRKTTGSYYTPTTLIDTLLDTALDPILDRAGKADDPEAAYLALTVCDPACGSGHFLVAAARRIAKRVAALRSGDPEPPPAQIRDALRDVVGRCIYGVDVNPLAAELAKVSLWLETMEPGKPLAYLDAQIKIGNSLIGATPALLAAGIPDEAFKPIEGDHRQAVSTLARRNKAERSGQDDLFGDDPTLLSNAALAERTAAELATGTLTLADVHVRRQRLKALAGTPEYRRQRLAADAWCAAFVAEKLPLTVNTVVTHAGLRKLERGETVRPETVADVERLAAEYRFFHWHLEFPHVFPTSVGRDLNHQTGWRGGFDAVLGNPPWEHVELKEQEFFDSRDSRIAGAAGATRKNLIQKLAAANPALYREYHEAKHQLDALRHFGSASGRYPLTGRGRIKTDPLFAELFRGLASPTGRAGIVVPTGIATDATTQYFFKDLVTTKSLAALFDFENRKPLFEGVDSRVKFCLLTMTGRAEPIPAARFAFFLHETTELPAREFRLTPDEITLLNPNTGTCPIFRTRRDAEITLGIYKRVPVLIKEGDPDGNPWGISFMQGLFNMTSDSHLFHTREELEDEGWVLNGNVFERPLSGGGYELMLPLYEAKMIHHYDTRWATYEPDGTTRLMTEDEKAQHLPPMPRYWVHEAEVDRAFGTATANLTHLFAWRGIARTTDVRTAIGCPVPKLPGGGNFDFVLGLSEANYAHFCAYFSSFVFDFCVRQKLSNMHLQFSVAKQLPIPRPLLEPPASIPVPTVVDVLNSYPRPEVREALRAQLDAFAMHAYGVSREDADYILETFPIVKRKDLAEFGEYRTKRLILQAYDAMADAVRAGSPYRSPLDQEVQS